ncbi:prepilin-type N-terminal cleavage/methylation domain-containing protein [Planctomycetota bacterium]
MATKQNGFTLIEILIAMVITSVLVLGLHAAFGQARLLQSRIQDNRDAYQQSRLFFETVRTELACLYFPKAGDEQELKPFSLSTLSDGTTQLTFYTLNPAWQNSPMACRSAKVTYLFAEDPQAEHKILTRTQASCSGEKVIAQESKETILDRLSQFNVWALDPNSDVESDSWKRNLASETTPPKVVKIELKWPQLEKQSELNFQTSIKIHCQNQ